MTRLLRKAGRWALPLVMALAACTVGPDFHRATVPMPPRWDDVSKQSDPSRPVATPVDPQWWTIFGDAELSSLIQRVATSNLDVRAASTRLWQSRAEREAVGADAMPNVEGEAAYQHAHASANGLVDPSDRNGESAYDVWQSDFDASWELDIWGRVRRETESADATVEASADARRGVLVSVLAETARDYMQLRAVQAKSAIARQQLDVARHSLKLSDIRFKDGVVTRLQVAQAASQVANVEARLPPLEQQQKRLINALSYLVAQPPRTLADELGLSTGVPPVPPRVPVGLPSQLAERRPDIRQAEAVLHGATADVGVAVGDFYPRITLSGDVGLQALQLSSFGAWGSRLFAVGPAISLPVFEGGRLHGTLDLRRAQQQEAAIHFQQTVLKAWREVDDGLTGYNTTQRRLDQLDEAVRQDQLVLAETQRQYVAGLDDLLQVLIAQQALLVSQEAAIDSSAEVSLALVSLYKSLGGGWETAFPAIAQSTAVWPAAQTTQDVPQTAAVDLRTK